MFSQKPKVCPRHLYTFVSFLHQTLRPPWTWLPSQSAGLTAHTLFLVCSLLSVGPLKTTFALNDLLCGLWQEVSLTSLYRSIMRSPTLFLIPMELCTVPECMYQKSWLCSDRLTHRTRRLGNKIAHGCCNRNDRFS